jgi:hypothetical protein
MSPVIRRTAVSMGAVLLCSQLFTAPGSAQAVIHEGIEINRRLQFLWDQYLKMIELLITLTTGTIALAAGLVKPDPTQPVADRDLYKWSMIFLVVSLFCAVSWRVIAQFEMEQEVFGNEASVAAYYSSEGVVAPFTTSYKYGDEGGINTALRYVVIFLMASTATGLVGGLGFLGAFAFNNLPPDTRKRLAWSQAHRKESP